eukprot:8205786-Pyramimonas_sp.AAC.1
MEVARWRRALAFGERPRACRHRRRRNPPRRITKSSQIHAKRKGCWKRRRAVGPKAGVAGIRRSAGICACLLYTSDAADDTPCVDL